MRRFCALIGLPSRTYYRRRKRAREGRSPRGPWPTPARDGVRAAVIEKGLSFPMWGHRKIAWLCRHDGIDLSDATCLRILREAGLVLPVDYARERRQLAAARREAFVKLPTRRNRVWQMDFFELETSGGGTWRSGDVIDYAAKYVLAGPVTATSTAKDAVESLQLAIAEAERLLGRPLLDDLTDPDTGELTSVIVVTDNGPCFKSRIFERFIDSRPELTHVRTRRRSPQTNGVIERYHGAIKIEHLWRELPADGLQMEQMVAAFRTIYNEIRPHETLAGARPIEAYLAAPSSTISTPVQTRQLVSDS